MKYFINNKLDVLKIKYHDYIIKMEHILKMEKRFGVDIGYHESNIHPKNGEGCVGVSGLDKTLSLERIIDIAYRMDERPNIIVKKGPNAKWYLKKASKDNIEEANQKQQWRDVSRCIMWIIEWDE